MSSNKSGRDLAAEIDALRAELDALKRAFMTETLDRKLSASERPLIVAEAVEAMSASTETATTSPKPPTSKDTV